MHQVPDNHVTYEEPTGEQSFRKISYWGLGKIREFPISAYLNYSFEK